MPDLTTKQELFAEHLMGEAAGNATLAARLAGYGGNDNTIRSIASENLTKPNIVAHVRERVSAVGKTADECLLALAAIIDIPNDTFLNAGRESKGTLADKVRSIELMMKYHQMLNERIEVNTTNTHRIEIKAIESVRTIDSTAVERDTDTTPSIHHTHNNKQ